jgi:hypothetical protein
MFTGSRAATVPCRLLIFEGIMGSGKTTATREFEKRLSAAGRNVLAYAEAADPHPVRASDDLPDFFQPWLHMPAMELAERVRSKWAGYVEQRLADDHFTIMDGQLFHGDMSNLFMMGMPPEDVATHVRELVRVLAPLRPLVVYLHQLELAGAIRTICDERGPGWQAYQLEWKLKSPYARQRALSGVEGLIAMYEAYRRVTDALFQELDCARINFDTSDGNWPAIYARVEDGLSEAGVTI